VARIKQQDRITRWADGSDRVFRLRHAIEYAPQIRHNLPYFIHIEYFTA
jgi:hypothetical protein